MSFGAVMAGTKLLFCVLIPSVVGTAAQTGRSLRGTTTTADVSSLQDATTTTVDVSSLQDATVKSCHDTKEGERCYTAVMWAMEHGIVVHPEWYPGLHVGSSFAEFQAHMDNIGHGECSDPCDICYTSEPGEQCYEAVTWAMEHGISQYPTAYGNLTSGSTFEEFQRVLYFEGKDGCKWPCSKCHTAVPDETCHAGVVWAMQHGIHEHPDWPIYSGLDAGSSFVDFQAALHRHQMDRCPEPCGLCHTAVEGEPCYEGVMWEMEYGINLHPEWYPELTTNSSFEDFQAHLHEGNVNQCPEPCRH